MSQQPTTRQSTVADGVARLVWPPGEPIDNVRREVARALVSHARVEAHVDHDDTEGQRIATWAGMLREGVMRGVTVDGTPVDRIVYARLATDRPVD